MTAKIINRWFWRQRKTLVLSILSWLLLELGLVWSSANFFFWLVLAILILWGYGWIWQDHKSRVDWSGLLYIWVLAFALILMPNFVLINPNNLHLIYFLFVFFIGVLFDFSRKHADADEISPQSIKLIDFTVLGTLFVELVTWLGITTYFYLPLWTEMLGLAIIAYSTLLFAFNYRGLNLKRFWIYLIVLGIIWFETAWLLGFWFTNDLYKSLIFVAFYYLFFELLRHWNAGRLTQRVINEYTAVAFLVILLALVANLVFVLL